MALSTKLAVPANETIISNIANESYLSGRTSPIEEL
jgi:hypothetical protein